jgi:hypothetical protein
MSGDLINPGQQLTGSEIEEISMKAGKQHECNQT